LERAAGLARDVAGAVIRVFFFARAEVVIVRRVSQDGQFMGRPSHSLLARMGWPQVAQLKVNSFIGRFGSFLWDYQDMAWTRPLSAVRPLRMKPSLRLSASGRIHGSPTMPNRNRTGNRY
jgi:hypothetical protein